MDYSKILQALNQASSFELYRLRAAIDNQLKSPERTKTIRSQLHIGQEVEIFDSEKNKTERAVITKFNPTSVDITLVERRLYWRIPYYWINVDHVDVAIKNTAKQGIDRNSLTVGDTVGFRNKDGHELYGKIIRLNPKTVTINTSRGKWRVAYSLLFPVFDSDLASKELQHGENDLLLGKPD